MENKSVWKASLPFQFSWCTSTYHYYYHAFKKFNLIKFPLHMDDGLRRQTQGDF